VPAQRVVLVRRWADLPPFARAPAQLPGRHAVGCSGIHGCSRANGAFTNAADALSALPPRPAWIADRFDSHSHGRDVVDTVSQLPGPEPPIGGQGTPYP